MSSPTPGPDQQPWGPPGPTGPQSGAPQYGPQHGSGPAPDSPPQYGSGPQYGPGAQWGNAPQPGNAPQWGTGSPWGNTPRWGGGPQLGGGWGGPPARRPGSVTAAGVVGVVWGGLAVLGGLVLVGATFSVGVFAGLVALFALALGVVLLIGGIRVLGGHSPRLLLRAAYVAIAVNAVSLIVSLADSSSGAAGNGVLGFVLPLVVVALLMGQRARQWYGAQGRSY